MVLQGYKVNVLQRGKLRVGRVVGGSGTISLNKKWRAPQMGVWRKGTLEGKKFRLVRVNPKKMFFVMNGDVQ